MGASMRWIYRVHKFGTDQTSSAIAEQLNILGAQGWELVSVAHALPGGHHYAYFKRAME